jgi:hypothetical protein
MCPQEKPKRADPLLSMKLVGTPLKIHYPDENTEIVRYIR